MRAGIIIFISLFLVSLSAAEENLYQYDSLKLQLDVEGDFEVLKTGTAAEVKELSVELLLVPAIEYRQQTIEWNSAGKKEEDKVIFQWDNPQFGIEKYGYSAIVRTKDGQLRVARKILFPITASKIAGLEQYLQPTEHIDSNHPAVVQKATELAEGQEDLFKVAFTVADWVEEHVQYDLNSVTATASQKASWVLENKQGVCDEMTSLFVAMMRSLGIPARFVSGVSYTTSPLFSEPWQPHGWAEVYFPEIGWVGFDITFGEYGYVDVTHIKFRDGFDPADPATRFLWKAYRADVEPGELTTEVAVLQHGAVLPNDIQVEIELLSDNIGISSYNLVKGILKNNANYYTARTLQLAVPEEVEIIGKNKRKVLLEPKQVKEIYWVVHVTDNLKENYIYTMPVVLYSETNVSVQDAFAVKSGNSIYSYDTIQKLTAMDEEKTYSRKISLNCNVPNALLLDETREIDCTLKNIGNTNLRQVQFCLKEICQYISLPINQEKTETITLRGETPGYHTFIASAENEVIEKKSAFEYAVYDAATVNVNIDHPSSAQYGNDIPITFSLERGSFNVPKNVSVEVSGAGMMQTWKIEELAEKTDFTIRIPGKRIASSTLITARVRWEDIQGKSYSWEEEISIEGKGENFMEKARLFLNRILNLF